MGKKLVKGLTDRELQHLETIGLNQRGSQAP